MFNPKPIIPAHISTALLLLSCSSAGCVSQARFDELMRRYDEAQALLAERQARVGSLDASFEASQAQVERLQQENLRVQAQLTALQHTRAGLEADQHRMTLEMTQLLEDSAQLKQSTEQLSAALAELTRRKAEADRRVAEFKGLLVRFKSLIDAGTLKVTISDGRMVLQLPTDVLFDSGSAKLSNPGKTAIAEITQVLKEVPGRHYQVEGHTDNVPIHNPLYRSNWELAAARGLGVVRAMVDSGVNSASISAASYGEFHPVASNAAEDGRRVNRRIEIIVVPDLSMLPGYQELQTAMQSSLQSEGLP